MAEGFYLFIFRNSIELGGIFEIAALTTPHFFSSRHLICLYV